MKMANEAAAPATGLAAILLAVGFNLPYGVLAATYEYPAILRRPAVEALEAFADGGPGLILTWYAFMLSALALVAIAPALAVTRTRIETRPALAISAAVAGALAGLAQAIGLSRWIFAVPGLARTGDPAAADAFDLLNAWGGVAIGEHIGQLLTAFFVLQTMRLQAGESRYVTAGLGALASLLLFAGSGEGLAIALGQSGELFSVATIGGFLALTLWLIATGVGMIRNRAEA